MAFPTQPSLPRLPTLSGRKLRRPAFVAWAGTLGAILAAALLAAGPAAASPDETVSLTWRNGDELSGQLLPGGGEGTVRFDARPFTAPLDLRLGQLAGIRFPAAIPRPEEPSTPHFALSLHNGDRLQGKLLRLDRNEILLDCSPQLGVIAIPRQSVARLAASNGGSLHFSQLGGLDEWSSTGRDRKPSDWFTGLRGELTTHQWSGNLYREIGFPEQVEVHFRVAVPEGRPNLEIGLLRNPEEGPMLETWDGILVLTYRSHFVPVMEMSESTKALDLRLFWDQGTGEVRLCSPSGEELASLGGATPEGPDAEKRRRSDPRHRGFFILNRNPELRLVSLQVRPWDGRPVPVIDLTRPRLHLRGEPVRFDTDEVLYTGSGETFQVGTKSVPLANLLEMTFAPAEESDTFPLPSSATRIAWHNGTTVSGAFLRIGPGELILTPPWTTETVPAALDGAREIRFPENTEALALARDTLTADDVSLRGTMRPAPAGSTGTALLSWLPPGALAAVPVDPEENITMARGALDEEMSGHQVGPGHARVYLTDDEILAGRLLSVAPEKIHFESRATGPIEIPAKHLRAIDTGTAGRILDGFKDSEWEEIEDLADQIVLSGDKVVIKDGSFGNPSILLGDRIRFTAEWTDSHGAMTLRFFASGPDNSTPSTDVIFAVQGNRLFIGKLNANGAFSFSGDQIPIVANRAAIDITATPEKIDIRVDGKNALSVEVEPGRVWGNGLYFKMGGGWPGWNQRSSVIEISGFRVGSSPGSVPRRIIDPRAKEHLLSIPRNLRENLPTHLLIARNGDLLRGGLVSGDENTLHFAAGEKTLEIPANRISNIIWLTPPTPAETSEKPAPESSDPAASPTPSTPPAPESRPTDPAIVDFPVTHQFILRDGTRLRLFGERVEGSRLVGRSPVLGECSIAVENIREARSGPPLPLAQAAPMDLVVFNDWETTFTPDPVLPDADGQPASPMIGKEAPAFSLNGLDQTKFTLSDHRGKVVVLDFWATWCGPCIKAMPDVLAAVEAFPEGTVAFCAVNQAESAPIVSAFLEARKWDSEPVALDFNMKVSRAYQVEGIPHTVVIDPAGKIAWVHTGYSPDLKRELFEAIAGILSRIGAAR
ncbi:MAG: TlpA family protein disulfide reductase [Verrucomicrobiaceae bacterium]|nr:TlpA family protein disulfide reductase [Verrucomicrobiaceae bacterium]